MHFQEKFGSVVIVVFDGASLLNISGPIETFAATSNLPHLGGHPYDVVVASVDGESITTSSGCRILTTALHDLKDTAAETIIVCGGLGVRSARKNMRLLAWIRQRSLTARRVCSIASGAFILAAAGLLSGRRAVTHWNWVDHFRRLHPDVDVHADPIYLQEGRIWTSAGVATALDVCLAMIEEDLGRSVAMQIARHLVVYARRSGEQHQLSSLLRAQACEKGRFEGLHEWISGNLSNDLTIDELAHRVGMSPRNFSRRYAREMGVAPGRAVESMRVDAARVMIEDTDDDIASVAALCGFKTGERMRRSFRRKLGIAPLDIRQARLRRKLA